MAFYNRRVGIKTHRSVIGTNVRNQDPVYFDRAKTRSRIDHWQPTRMFKMGPWLAFAVSTVLFVILGTFLGYAILLAVQEVYGSFSRGQYIYPLLNIPWRHSEFFSLTFWMATRWWLWAVAAIGGMVLANILSRYNQRIIAMNTDEDISDIEGDATVLTIPELVSKYKPVPDRGAHFSGVDATALVSHIVISNKGIKKQRIPVLKSIDVKGKHQHVPVYENEDNSKSGYRKIKTSMQPLIDTKSGLQQLENVGMTDKRFLKPHDPSRLLYNRKKKISLAMYINKHWYIPDYETQRPSGVYLVDDSPINVLVVAMTRGNKGQCIINPMLDIWTRQDKKANLFVNDPKGELYTAFYATLKMRNYDVVVFNLLDSMFTDQYNPLAPAITYVRKGYMDEPQKVLTNLATNFFPMPKNSEPIWTKGEQMLFTILCLTLMDIYYEEEQEYLGKYGSIYDEAKIQRDLDALWGHVTLPNVYRMVSVLATRKYVERDLDGSVMTDENGEPVKPDDSSSNMLEKLFELTSKLPQSNIRQLFLGPYSNLMSMADSEKMRSSIYGMTLTEMAFFVEGPVVSLTNASPRKSFDLISMSFPRRFQFKFNDEFVADRGYVSSMVDFELYRDPEFKQRYEGDEYEHHTRVDKLSWAEMRFGAILDQPRTYVKMTVRPRGQSTHMIYGEYYAEFTKGYQKSFDGRGFVKDPITDQYQVKDGVLRLGVIDSKTHRFKHARPLATLSSGKQVSVFDLTEAAYQEKPMAVFSVTPPSALVYVKIILMIIHSLFNSNVENSYMTKDNGKPLLKTKYMLDEAGNLSYEGNGIDGLPTKLSIGLAQGQEYTMIFQTLQQITDIYGDTADRIISSNTGLMTFLLSTDLDMLETLSKQAGVQHVGNFNNKTFQKHVGTVLNQVEDSFSYTRTMSEQPLFSVNRLLHMTNGEALMLSSTKRNTNDGSNSRQQPIFDTQDTSLPMAWSLHMYGYGQRSYSMMTVPTQSSTVGMDESIPDFESLIYKRAAQASLAPKIIESYKKEHGLSDIKYDLLDSKEVGREIMNNINACLVTLHNHEAMTVDDLDNQNSTAEDLKETIGEEDKQRLQEEAQEFADIDYGDEDDVDEEAEQATADVFREAGQSAALKEKAGVSSETELREQIKKDTNIDVDVDEDGKASIENVVIDKDIQEKAMEAQRKKDELEAKKYGGGQFSERDMGTGIFNTAVVAGLTKMPPSWNKDGWHRVRKGTDNYLEYNGTKVAQVRIVKQDQKAVISDAVGGDDAPVEVGQTVKAHSWELLDGMKEALKATPDWRSSLGPVFFNTLVAAFKQRNSIDEDRVMRTE